VKIAVGVDHAGFELKAAVLEELRARGFELVDCGTYDRTACDYPDFAAKVAGMVSRGEAQRGVLVCGTGQGMCMAANRFRGVRAAVVYDDFSARMTRSHNDANVICLGGRVLDPAQARHLLGLWLETPFEGDRHSRRVGKIDSLGCQSRGEG
jgi:ribose 5-phosphate isomerase B